MSFIMRLAEPKDFEHCLAFDCTDPTESRGDEEKAALIRAKIDLKMIYLASTPDGHAVGYMTIDVMWPMMLPLLSWVYVAPAWRHQNIAHELFAFAQSDLKARDYKRILISTQTDRDLMLASLRQSGLREIGTINANPDSNIGEVFFMQDL